MKLNEIKDNDGARKGRMRVGRGIGSGKGKTCGRGNKGQKSRTGVAAAGFEGGQMPIYRRLPKRGFNNKKFALDIQGINLEVIQAAIDKGVLNAADEIDLKVLKKNGLVRNNKDGVKVLSMGEIKAKVKLKVYGISAKARELVEKAGGSIVIDKPTAEVKE